MRITNNKSITITAFALLAAAGAVGIGCKDAGSSTMSMIQAVGNIGHSSNPPPQANDGSNNTMTAALTNAVPGQAGGYLNAGMTAFSGLKMGRDDEDKMGRAVAITVTNTYPVDSNAALNKYVAMVGYTVAESSPRPDGNFVFGVLATDTVGAYSGPNGYVMITRGALRCMSDEAELAGVLAHEIAHVCNQDGLNAVRHAKLSKAGAQAAKTALDAHDTVASFDVAIDAGTDVIFVKGYDREQETAADKDAVTYMTAAGYDPASYLRFINRIAATKGAGGGVSTLFSTHPGLGDRSIVVAAAVATTGKSGTGATNRQRFQTNTH